MLAGPKIKRSLIAFLPLVGLAGCIDPYWPELGVKYDNVLVVDGMVTDDAGPHTIKLSRSSLVEDADFIPLSGCEVSVEDNAGNVVSFFEENEGVYATIEGNLIGHAGAAYRTIILTPDGIRYESDFEVLPESTAIEAINHKLEYREVADGSHPINGVQFYVSTTQATQDTNYFLWRLESTFKFQANHRVRYIFDGEFHDFTPNDSLLNCWRTASVKKIFTYSTVNLDDPVIRDFPLNYVTTQTKELSEAIQFAGPAIVHQ